jgi:hypothetical protein
MDFKNIKSQTESVLTLSNGKLEAVVWRNKAGDQIFYKCEKMSVEEIAHLIDRNSEKEEEK